MLTRATSGLSSTSSTVPLPPISVTLVRSASDPISCRGSRIVTLVDGKPDRADDAGLENLANGRDPLGHIGRLGIDALPPREAQELAGQRRAAPGGGFDRGDRALHPGIRACSPLQEVKAAADD